jgi:hypothetical protein
VYLPSGSLPTGTRIWVSKPASPNLTPNVHLYYGGLTLLDPFLADFVFSGCHTKLLVTCYQHNYTPHTVFGAENDVFPDILEALGGWGVFDNA